MQIINGKIVPAFDPALIKAALAFLQRCQLSGAEAPTHVAACDLLVAIADGTLVVSAAGPDLAATGGAGGKGGTEAGQESGHGQT